jgi:hypothetical protein
MSMSKECETGCGVFEGGYIMHHRDCVYYPDSVAKMLDDTKASNTALREELAALKAYNSELARAGEFIDHPMVSQLSEKWVDDFKSSLAKTPAQSLAKVRADAIRDAAYQIIWGDSLIHAQAVPRLEIYANKIEAGL